MGDLTDYVPLVIIALPVIGAVLYWGAIAGAVFGVAAGALSFFGIDLLGGTLSLIARPAAMVLAALALFYAAKRLLGAKNFMRQAEYVPFVILVGMGLLAAKYSLSGTLLAAGADPSVIGGVAVGNDFLIGIIAGIVVAIGAIKVFKLR